MLRKIILILALICMIVLPIFGQTGNYTTSSNIVKCADYDHPDDAITAIGASNKTLLVTESETCDTNFTVPTNVTVKFERGGKWTINNGITVTFNGQIDAGLWQIFSYTGTGTLAGTPIIKEIFPQWWATGDGTVENPWANNCIRKAYYFVPAGGTIFLKAGYYKLSTQVRITKQINIIGEGMNKTIIITANSHGFLIREDVSGVSYVSIKNLTIDGDAQTDGTQYLSCISFFRGCDYASLEDIEVKNAGYYGIDIFEVNHSLFQNIHAHDNYRHGMHPGTNTTGRNKWNIYRDIYAWNNGVAGFSDRGCNVTGKYEATFNVYDNINCWDNADGNTLNAFIVGCQKNVVISNCLVDSNDGIGMRLSYLEDSSIINCTITNSATYGINIVGSKNLNFTNVIVKNNNVSDTDNTSGIRIENSSRIKFTSCQSYDDRDTPIQEYGIRMIGAVDFIEIINCILTPNEKGTILNHDNAIIISGDG